MILVRFAAGLAETVRLWRAGVPKGPRFGTWTCQKRRFLARRSRPEGTQIEDEFFLLLASCVPINLR